MSSAQEVGVLRKAGRLDEAEQVAQARLAVTPEDAYLQNAYGWVIYERLKRAISDYEQRALPPSGLVAVFDRSLDAYARLLQLRRPDLLHSLILTMVLKAAREWHRFLVFARWWDPESFRDEDRKHFVTDAGKKIPSLELRFAYAIGRALIREVAQGKSEIFDWAVRQLDDALKHHGDDQWLHYYKSKLLLSQNRIDEARKYLLPVVKRQQRASWAWSFLGQTWEVESPEKAIFCYQYAVFLANKPESVLNTRTRLATLLAQAERFPEAAKQILNALEVRKNCGYKIPVDLMQLSHSQWYTDAIDRKDLPREVDVRNAAMDLLFDDLVFRPGVIDHQNVEKSLAYIAFSPTEGVILKYSRFRGIEQIPVRKVVEVGFESENYKRPIRWCSSDADSIPGFIEEFEGVLEQPSGKTFGFVRVDGNDDIFVSPFVMPESGALVGMSVKCRAIMSENKKRGVLGWKALSVRGEE